MLQCAYCMVMTPAGGSVGFAVLGTALVFAERVRKGRWLLSPRHTTTNAPLQHRSSQGFLICMCACYPFGSGKRDEQGCLKLIDVPDFAVEDGNMRGLAFAYDPSGYWIELIDRKASFSLQDLPMSLLLEEAEKRFEARLQLAEKDAQAEQRTLEAKANIMELELRAFTAKALADAQLAVNRAERREEEAWEASKVAQQRAEQQRLKAEAERHRFQELIAEERQAKEVQVAEMERLMQLLQSDADRQVRRIQEQMDHLEVDTARRIAECQRFSNNLQIQSERLVKRAETLADEKTQALQVQQAQQVRELQQFLEECQVEARQRVDRAQLESEVRIDVAVRNGLLQAQRGQKAAEAHLALSVQASST
eukprot:symbB.v1.2.028959.t1/scaffold3122.1/size63105/3